MTLKVKVALGCAAILVGWLLFREIAGRTGDAPTSASSSPALAAGATESTQPRVPANRELEVTGEPVQRTASVRAASIGANSASEQHAQAVEAGTQRLTIHVVDREGLALAGVSLTTRSGDLLATASSSGAIELHYNTHLDLASLLPAFAAKRGYTTAVARLPPRGVSDMTVELSPESPTCSFTVVNSGQVPQPGACVVLAPRDHPGETPLFTLWQAAQQAQRYGLLADIDSTRLLATTTDEDGTASLAAAPSRYALLVYAPGYLRHEEQLDLRSGDALPRKFTISLSPGRELRGRVVDEQTSLPIEGARVWHPASGSDAVTTNDRGEFVAIVPEEPATRALRVFHPDYAPLLAEQSGYAEFAMKHGLTAHLRFVDSNGQPVTSDVVIEGTPRSFDTGADARFAYLRAIRVDAQGDADLRGIVPGYLHELSFHAPGLARATVLVESTAPMFGDERTVVTLAKLSVCRVIVLDTGAHRVEGCQASFTTATEVGGRTNYTGPVPMIEDEPGVYLLSSYLVSADSEVTVEAWKGRSFGSKVAKASAQPFPAEVTLELQEH
jgi:hypothetical protein